MQSLEIDSKWTQLWYIAYKDFRATILNLSQVLNNVLRPKGKYDINDKK